MGWPVRVRPRVPWESRRSSMFTTNALRQCFVLGGLGVRIPGSADLIAERSRVMVADRSCLTASASGGGGGASSVRERRLLPPVASEAPGLLRTCAISPRTPEGAASGEQCIGCRPGRSLASSNAPPAVRPRALPREVESCEASGDTERKAFAEETERRMTRERSVCPGAPILLLRATMPAPNAQRSDESARTAPWASKRSGYETNPQTRIQRGEGDACTA